MSIWDVAPISVDSEIVLENWTIFEVSSDLWPEKTQHFVGYDNFRGEGRVSNIIIQLDLAKAVGTTKRGRVYRLQGPQGFGSHDGLYVWEHWCSINKVTKADQIKVALT